MKRMLILIAIAFALTGGALLYCGGTRKSVRAEASTAATADVPPPASRSSILEQRLAEALERVAQAPTAPEPSTAPVSSASAAASSPPPPAPEEITAYVRSAFAGEARDAAWSSRAERTIEERIAALAPGARVDCREKTCRVESSDTPDAMRAVRAAVGAPGDALTSGAALSSVEDDGSGGRVRITYLARAGESLPSP